jgi:catechol 2,3-dioxygenase-like lactoylglutathione lyase family enzyme
MESTVAFESIAPVIRVRDIAAALDRYRRLGFRAESYDGPAAYAFVDRGSVSMHLIQWGEYDPDQCGGVMVYMYVSDVDAVYAEWSRAGVPGELEDLEDRDYGLREFAYRDPDGTLHRVGSPLPKAGD